MLMDRQIAGCCIDCFCKKILLILQRPYVKCVCLVAGLAASPGPGGLESGSGRGFTPVVHCLIKAHTTHTRGSASMLAVYHLLHHSYSARGPTSVVVVIDQVTIFCMFLVGGYIWRNTREHGENMQTPHRKALLTR